MGTPYLGVPILNRIFQQWFKKIAYSHLRNSASRISIIGYVLLDGLIQRNERRSGAKFLVKYSLGHVNCFVSIHKLLQLSVFYHHHEEPCLSD